RVPTRLVGPVDDPAFLIIQLGDLPRPQKRDPQTAALPRRLPRRQGAAAAHRHAELVDRVPRRSPGVVAVGGDRYLAGHAPPASRLHHDLVAVRPVDVKRLPRQPLAALPLHQHAERLLAEVDFDLLLRAELAVEALLLGQRRPVALDLALDAPDAALEE